MSQTEKEPERPPEGNAVDNYLKVLQVSHDGYPDCCTSHVLYEVVVEHRHGLETGTFPVDH